MFGLFLVFSMVHTYALHMFPGVHMWDSAWALSIGVESQVLHGLVKTWIVQLLHFCQLVFFKNCSLSH